MELDERQEWYRLVGTSHIARQAVRRIKEAFAEEVPDVVALELDPARLDALLSEEKPRYSLGLVKAVGLRGFLFALIGSWLQRKLGESIQMVPGADMLAAYREARRRGKRVLLIDQPINVTLRRLSRALGWRELRQALRDSWRGLRGVTLQLDEVPDEALVERLLGEFKERYPRPYEALVGERNQYMARALKAYHERFPDDRVLVVIGIGHQAGLRELLTSSRKA